MDLCKLKFIGFALLANFVTLFGQYVNKAPWPTYSLQNMPQTSFSCHGKILGGYYADSETKCQMFHVCVKVPGVGIQDFRFLCPNGTAFDQEAQICADWGDVDCELSTLYYSNDNFDLYRIGSGFESKRAPLAEENESTFHLQRAETNDLRRSKQITVDQNPLYQKAERLSSTQNQQTQTFQNYGSVEKDHHSLFPDNSYHSKKSTNNDSKIEITANLEDKHEDDIFKGSHTSNYFSNRNRGRDDEPVAQVITNTKYTNEQQTPKRRHRIKPLRKQNNRSIVTNTTNRKITNKPTPDVKSTAPNAPNKKLTLQTSFITPNSRQDDIELYRKKKTENQKRIQAQQNIRPTTYSPDHRLEYLLSSTTRYRSTSPKSNNDDYRGRSTQKPYNVEPFGENHNHNQHKGIDNKQNKKVIEIYEKNTEQTRNTSKARSNVNRIQAKKQQNIQQVHFNENNEFQRRQPYGLSNQLPQGFKPANLENGLEVLKTNSKITLQPPYLDNNFTPTPVTQSPRGFDNPIDLKGIFPSNPNFNQFDERQNSGIFPDKTLGINYFDDQYKPTTFKPSTYKKGGDNIDYSKTEKNYLNKYTAASYLPTTQNSLISSTPDENDGQYHPELYEKDFAKNKLKAKKAQKKEKLKADLSKIEYQAGDEEDEFLKADHSLNIAAGANEFREKSLKQSSLSYSKAFTPSSKKTKKIEKDIDASYDYAYYDSDKTSPHDYINYDIIEDFHKTKTK